MNYKIKSFIYHELPSENLVVQSRKGIVEIENNEMINFIKEIDNQDKYSILSFDFISHHFKDITTEALDFLCNYDILSKQQDYNFRIKRLFFFTNNQKMNSLVHSLQSVRSSKDIEFIIITEENLKELTLLETDFVFTFINPYSDDLVDYILKIVNTSNSVLQLCYSYNNNVYVDNLYKSDWNVPCHYCNKAHIENQLRVSVYENLTYQHIIDSLYQKDPTFKVEASYDLRELLFIFNYLLINLDKFILRTNGRTLNDNEFVHDITNVSMLNMKTLKLTRDTAIHWELCNCYG